MREDWGSILGQIKLAQCRQRLATAATFLRRCVDQVLSCGDGSLHSLHASAEYREYHEDLILDLESIRLRLISESCAFRTRSQVVFIF